MPEYAVHLGSRTPIDTVAAARVCGARVYDDGDLAQVWGEPAWPGAERHIVVVFDAATDVEAERTGHRITTELVDAGFVEAPSNPAVTSAHIWSALLEDGVRLGDADWAEHDQMAGI
jgi:hypothetical protein